jgi:hypothetical protein
MTDTAPLHHISTTVWGDGQVTITCCCDKLNATVTIDRVQPTIDEHLAAADYLAAKAGGEDPMEET